MEFFLGITVPVLAFFFESYPRILNRKFGVDVWTHLLYLQEYHKQQGIPKRINSGFLVTGEYDYPPAFIFILSKFPFRLVEKYEFFFSPFFDALHIFIIFYLTFLLSGNVYFALLTQIIYLLTPIIVIENSSATPRSLGYTLFTLTFMSLFGFVSAGNILYLMTSIVLGSLIFLSHRFTTQGFLFFSLFFSVYTQNVIFSIVFFVSFLLAIIFSRGFYLKVLGGHLGNLKFWHKTISYRFAHQVYGNKKNKKSNDFIFKVYNEFLKFPPFVLSITNPWTLTVFYYLFFINSQQQYIQFLIHWVVFSYILAIVTIWVPFLRFLGEGQRYLELSVFPAAYIASEVMFNAVNAATRPIFIGIYILFSLGSLLTIIVIQRKAIIYETLRTLTPSMERIFDYLLSLKNKPKLLCIPHQITTNTIYHTGCPVFVNADYTNIDKISDVYPYLRMTVDKIMHKHGLDMILLNEDYAPRQDLPFKGKYEVVKEVKPFVLLRLKHEK